MKTVDDFKIFINNKSTHVIGFIDFLSATIEVIHLRARLNNNTYHFVGLSLKFMSNVKAIVFCNLQPSSL